MKPEAGEELDRAVLKSVARQLMAQNAIVVDDKTSLVRRSSRNQLRMASFEMGGHAFQAIEQNPDKPSRWGQLAREGHQVVQFKDVETNRFVAISVDGKVMIYSAMSR